MTATDRPTEPPVECVAVDRDERCLCPGGPASHRPSPPAPAAEDDAVEKAARVWHAEDATEPRAWDALSDDERGWYIATTRKSLAAAGVSALRAEVEKLRQWKAEALPVMAGLQDLGDALGVGLGQSITGAGVEKARDLLARATSAEQERDEARQQVADLRADAVVVARALLDERGQVAAEPAAWRILAGSGDVESPAPNVATSEGRDKAVATSGEQPGPLKAGVMALTGLSSDEVDALGGVREDDRPAPAVPDGGHVLTEYGTTSCPVEIVRAEVVDGKCSACGAVVPDSTGLREQLWEAIVKVRDAAPRLPDDADTDDIVDAVLAVVGQGVTAAQAWDECVQAVAWAMDNGPDPLRYVAEHNPYPAVVRSGEQGGE